MFETQLNPNGAKRIDMGIGIAGGMAAANPVKPQPQLITKLRELSSGIDEAHAHLSNLEAALSSVLRPSQPTPGVSGTDKPRAQQSPAVDNLEDISQCVGALVYRLQEISNRLEA